MFAFDVEKEKFALKPMNCPGHWYVLLYVIVVRATLHMSVCLFGCLSYVCLTFHLPFWLGLRMTGNHQANLVVVIADMVTMSTGRSNCLPNFAAYK